MPLRTAQLKKGDTVSYRASSGKTYNVTVTGEQPATPTLNVPTTQTSGGTLGAAVATSYRLGVVINGAESQASTAQGVTTGAGSTNQVTLTWPTVTGAQAYRVYGRTAGTQLFMAEVPGGTTTWIDTGAVTPAGALPGAGEVGGRIGPIRGLSMQKATAMRQGDRYYLR